MAGARTSQECAVGVWREMTCSDCGYHAAVAGERDNNGFGSMETRACRSCRNLVEVSIDATPDPLCPQCGAASLEDWTRRGDGWDPCPRCGGLILSYDCGIRN